MLVPFTSLLALASLVVAAPLEKRSKVLASGNGMKSGAISKTLSWQSSGKLIQGGCPSTVKISSCYQVLLNSAGNLASRSLSDDSIFADSDDSHHQTTLSDAYYAETSPFLAPAEIGGPEYEEMTVEVEDSSALVKRASARQRIEMYSMPLAASGSTWTFTWKSYLSTGTSTSGTFFHLFQLLRRDGNGGYILSLGAVNGKAVVQDSIRGCSSCASIPISSFTGKTVSHTLKVKFGSSGTLSYKAVDSASKKTLLSYSAKGQMGSSASLKAGAYRAVTSGMSAVKAYVGDFAFKKS
ncbi:hypothetical protein BCR35DRAFT_283153 [Leucosporidium creatinivorum]|uniref:Uncharacterized protein n=1 Tax=Leucosporidium creatinivorum TaxID=106004 RepID=A0A1Y2DZG9_9BASI|nr:hypothetical protein BCR35DRAFT_283153 [Leucosporidium creatinivorum]